MKTAGRAFGALAAAAALLTGVAIAAAGPVKQHVAPLAGVVHADVTTLSAKGVTRVTSLDRGAITSLSTTAVTLKRADGQSVSLAIGAGTRVRGAPAVGAKALALSRDGTALLLRARGAALGAMGARAAVRPLRARLLRGSVHADLSLIRPDGSTDSIAYDRGRITAVSSSSISLTRRDGKAVTLAVDSSTRVRERGKAATLSDLQAGEPAMVFSRAGKAFLIRGVAKATS